MDDSYPFLVKVRWFITGFSTFWNKKNYRIHQTWLSDPIKATTMIQQEVHTKSDSIKSQEAMAIDQFLIDTTVSDLNHINHG